MPADPIPAGPAGALLAAALRSAGVDAIYGEPIAGLAVVPVPSAELAGLLAAVHFRVAGRAALVAHGHELRAPGADPARVTVTSPADVAALTPVIVAARSAGLVID